jgi:hypothetical protein
MTNARQCLGLAVRRRPEHRHPPKGWSFSRFRNHQYLIYFHKLIGVSGKYGSSCYRYIIHYMKVTLKVKKVEGSSLVSVDKILSIYCVFNN